jgi:hypothetical protein
MITRLFLAAALLLPGLAYAGNPPSADLSVKVVPAGSNPIACDIGPPYTGVVPDAAARAGYTHCAVNLDFTQFTNANQFLDCLGASSPLLYYDTTKPLTEQVPCDTSHYAIVPDGGSNSFQLSYLASDFGNPANGKGNILASFKKAGATVLGPYTGWTVAPGYYFEEVWRVANPATFTDSNNNWLNVSTMSTFFYTPLFGFNPNSGAFFENDPDESFMGANSGPQNPPNSNSNEPFVTWQSSGPPYNHNPSPCCYDPSPQPDTSQYTTVGYRMTADGSANAAACFYLDLGVINTSSSARSQWDCASNLNNPTVATTDKIWTSRQALVFGCVGTTCIGNTAVAHMTGDLRVNYKRVTIWSCPNWRDNNQTLDQGPLANECWPGVFTGTP